MKLIVLVCTVLVSNFLFAQSPNEYIVQESDTIYGEVHVVSTNKKIAHIELLREGSVSKERFYPTQLKSFFSKNFGLYESHLIEADKFYAGNKVLPDSGKTVEFLEILIKGELTLFSYNEGSIFFIRYQANDLEQLVYRERKVIVDETGKIVNTSTSQTREKIIKEDVYKRQLASYMTAKCGEIYKTITNTQLTTRSLVSLFEEYNACDKSQKGEKITEIKERQGLLKLGAFVGYSFTQLDFVQNGSSYHPLLDTEFSMAQSFVPGFYLDYFISKRNPKLSALFELAYQGINTSGSGYTFDGSFLKLNTSVKYAFNHNKKFIPEVILGLSNSIMINGTFGATSEEDLKKWGIGYIVGGGVRRDKISITVRYESTGGIVEPTYSYRARINSIYLIMSYRLIQRD